MFSSVLRRSGYGASHRTQLAVCVMITSKLDRAATRMVDSG